MNESDYLERNFSLFENGIANTTNNRPIEIKEFLQILRTPDERINRIRSETDKQERNNLKKGLSYVTFAGIFTKRANDFLVNSSGLACFDLDNVQNLEEQKALILKDKYTHLCFISPSGSGLKFIVKIPKVKNDAEYKEYYETIKRHYKLKLDSTQDISRACYVSYDPDYFFNPKSEIFTEKEIPRTLTEETEEQEAGDEKIINAIIPEWIPGQRQNKALALAGFLRKEKRYGFDHAKKIIEEICKRTQDTEVKERLQGLQATYLKDEKKVLGISGLGEKIKEEYSPDLLTGTFLHYQEVDDKENGGKKKVPVGVNIEKLSHYLVEKHNIKTVWGTKNDKMYVFDGRIFKEGARGIVKAETETILNSWAKRNVVDEVYEKIKRLTHTETFGEQNINHIPLENGVYNIETKELEEYTPEHNFNFMIRCTYEKSARCETWLKFLEETLYPEDVPVCQEWFGFHLYRKYIIKKAVLCLGEPDTGKTVLIDTLTDFIGEENKTGIPLQKLTSGSDFTKFFLRGKHANIYDDLSSKDLTDGGAFKVATGGGWISGEEKFGDLVQFKSFAKQTMTANKVPPVKDNDDKAYFGRWMVFKHDNVPEKMDTHLKEKIIKEKSGILIWALEGLHRLLEQREFSYKKTAEENKKLMESSGNPYTAFANEVLEKETNHKITKEQMFNAYTFWCNETGRPRNTKELLGRRLEKACDYILAKGGNDRVWINARFKKGYEKFMEKGADNPSLDDFGGEKQAYDTNDTFLKEDNTKLEETTKKVDNYDTNDTFKKTMSMYSEEEYSDSKIHDVYSLKSVNSVINKDLEKAKKILEKFPEKPSIAFLISSSGLDFPSCVAIREQWQEAYDLVSKEAPQ